MTSTTDEAIIDAEGYRRACAVADIPSTGALKVVFGRKGIAVVKTDEGFFAVDDACSHADVSLSEGEAYDCVIECWLHGAEFDLRTGAALSLPATEPLATYPVKVADDPAGVSSVYVLTSQES